MWTTSFRQAAQSACPRRSDCRNSNSVGDVGGEHKPLVVGDSKVLNTSTDLHRGDPNIQDHTRVFRAGDVAVQSYSTVLSDSVVHTEGRVTSMFQKSCKRVGCNDLAQTR